MAFSPLIRFLLILSMLAIHTSCRSKKEFSSQDIKRGKERRSFGKNNASEKSKKDKPSAFKLRKKESKNSSESNTGFSIKRRKNIKGDQGDSFSAAVRKENKRKNGNEFASTRKARSYEDKPGRIEKLFRRSPKPNDAFSGSYKVKSYETSKKKTLLTRIGIKPKVKSNDAFSSGYSEKAYVKNKKKTLLTRIGIKRKVKENDAFASSRKAKAYEDNNAAPKKKGFIGRAIARIKRPGRPGGGNDHFASEKKKAKPRKPQVGLFPKGVMK